ncbi:Uncharacterised protein [Vibrio cholerae]|nr:Uncharacterised protein [Vibrio cholerae]
MALHLAHVATRRLPASDIRLVGFAKQSQSNAADLAQSARLNGAAPTRECYPLSPIRHAPTAQVDSTHSTKRSNQATAHLNSAPARGNRSH